MVQAATANSRLATGNWQEPQSGSTAIAWDVSPRSVAGCLASRRATAQIQAENWQLATGNCFSMTRWSFDPDPEQELVTIRVFEKQAEYAIARTLLESAGIECFSENEHAHRLMTGAHRALGVDGTMLRVRKSDANDAIAILDAPFDENYIVEDPPSES